MMRLILRRSTNYDVANSDLILILGN
uniref:Uncharacterized protein n=1 Tax=Arundo donax TaxID=35708 RepID=A0A0A9H934_ARUDO